MNYKWLQKLPLIGFLFAVGFLLYLRLKQFVVFLVATVEVLGDFLNQYKTVFVQSMFWGRGQLYRNVFHIAMIFLTSLLLLTGVLSNLSSAQAQQQALEISYGAIGNNDLLAQGASISTVLSVEEAQVNYEVVTHIVKAGESLDDLAKKYSVSKDTIRWANQSLISPYNDNIDAGWSLRIPEMDGVLHEVKSGEDLDDVVALTKGNRFDIIELNNLVPPNYNLKAGQRLFVPNGELPPPPPLIPRPRGIPAPSSGGYVGSGFTVTQTIGGLPLGTFDDPLTHPRCAGYGYSRGFSSWHRGVDLVRAGGCPIRAAADGVVTYAGWFAGGAGYTVIIDHGNGVQSHYYHGTGDIWVRQGQRVSKGQDIMYMGCTGNCSGTHLHLTLRYNGRSIDPAPYIPYRRP